MAASAISRRVSEFVGVALFAAALIWLIALSSYSPSDPVWFFNTAAARAPSNFAGRVGAFVAELSFQLFGYAAYLIPFVLAVVGWHYFWCRVLDAGYTKAFGAALLFASVSAFLSLAFTTLDVGGRAFLAGGYVGKWLSSGLAEYLNRTGSIILILTLLFLATVLVTQFSFGRLFAVLAQFGRDRVAEAIAAMRERREEQRREKQRQEVLKKHLEKGSAKEPKTARPAAAPVITPAEPVAHRAAAARDAASEPPPRSSKAAAMVEAAAAALKAAS